MSIDRLLSIMATLRDPERGCEWDRAQNFASIAPYTIEEAYEVLDAIERHDLDDLRGELGDLLLQVVFHSRMAEELGAFTFDDVAEAIADKMQARHPHIFGDQHGAMTETRWEELKASEREAAGSTSAMDGLAAALPAAMRACKIQKRAARDGFDWPDRDGPSAKVLEEIDELAATENDDEREDEAGDLLFAVINLVRKYGVEPEAALRRANSKFEARYRVMERAAEGRFADLSLDEQERLWLEAKASLGKSSAS